MKKTIRGAILLLLGGLTLASLGGCTTPQNLPSADVVGAKPSSYESTSPALAPVRPKPDPVDLAQQSIDLAKMRRSQLPIELEFNGYNDFVGVASSKEGLVRRYARSVKEKEAVDFQEMSAPESAEPPPLAQDLEKLYRAAFKPTLSAALEIPETGPIKVPNSKKFLAVVSALSLVPMSESNDPNPDRRIQRYLSTLKVARKVAVGATTREHYLAGLRLQDQALDGLADVVKSGNLPTATLRDIIAGAQMNVSSGNEYVAILENEYLIASRELEQKKLAPADLKKEQKGLAAVHLAVHTLASQPEPPVDGSRRLAEVPETEGCKFSNQEPEDLKALLHSRRSVTQLGVLEVLAATEAYKMESGAYPTALENLVPGYLTRIPNDWVSSSGALTYQVKDDSYTLKSVATEDKNSVTW